MQPAISLTEFYQTFHNIGCFYCFGRFSKRIRETILEICRKRLHLVIAFQEGGAASTTLLMVALQVKNDASYNSVYAAYGDITVRMVCAAGPNGAKMHGR